jgi:hypothetical protein
MDLIRRKFKKPNKTPKKTIKPNKTQKKTTGLFFFFNRVFANPDVDPASFNLIRNMTSGKTGSLGI